MKNRVYILLLLLFLTVNMVFAAVGNDDTYIPPPSGGLIYFVEGTIAEMQGDYELALKSYEKAAQFDQSATEPLMSIMEIAIGFGDFDHAIKVAEEIIDRDSTNTEMKKMMVDIYLKSDRTPDAILLLEDLIRLEPDSMSSYFTLAQLYSQQGDTAEALQIAKLAEEQFADSASDIKAVGDFYLHLYKLDKAEELFKKAIKEDKNYATSYLGLALVYERTDRAEEAKKAYEKFFELDSKPEDIYLSYLALIARDNEIEDAISKALEYIEEYPSAGRVLRRLGYLYLLDDKNNKSIPYLKDAYNILQDDPTQLVFIAELFAENEQYDSAKVYWQQYLIYDETVQTSAEYYEFLLGIGDTLSWKTGFDSLRTVYPDTALFDVFTASRFFDEANFDSAIVYLNRALEKEQNNSAILFTLGDAYERIGNRQEAIAVFDSLLNLMPDNPVFMNYLGYILTDENIRLQEAESLVKRALDFEPNSGAYLDSYAWVLYRQGKFEDALEYINKALEAFDEDPVIYDHKAHILKALDRTDDAIVNWRKAIEMSNDENFIRQIENSIKQKK